MTRAPGYFRRASGPRTFTISQELQPRHQIVRSARSESSIKNKVRMKKVFDKYSSVHPLPVHTNGKLHQSVSVWIINLLNDYCRTGSENPMSHSTLLASLQGLRMMFDEIGHEGLWQTNDDESARGNPLKGNMDVTAFISSHKISLAEANYAETKNNPITVSQVAHHAEKFWFGGTTLSNRLPNKRDVALHAALIVGMNMGMRFDELSKIHISEVSVDNGKVVMNLRQKIKNSTTFRSYKLRDWPASSLIRYSIYLDPQLAILSWLTVRGSRKGPLFCDIVQNNEGGFIDHTRAWKTDSFTSFLRLRLHNIGVGERDCGMYSGHSIKRGSVQLYRSLGLLDVEIMKIIQMVGANAYRNYCEAYNDCLPEQLPAYSGISCLLRSSGLLQLETKLRLMHHNMFYEPKNRPSV